MTIKKALYITGVVIAFHALGLIFDLYFYLPWFDIPMHFGGGLAMGALGLGLWNEAVHDLKFKGYFARHLEFWLIPLFVISFVSLISVLWEMHEFILDFVSPTIQMIRQPSINDTMSDFFNDLAGGLVALAIFYRKI